MTNRIIDIILKTLNYLNNWKLFVGKDPRHVLPGALVIFPLFPDRLFCGLAGILAIRKNTDHGQENVIEAISDSFREGARNNLKSLGFADNSSEYYLGGNDMLEVMRENLHKLKQDSHMEDIFFEIRNGKKLKSLNRNMKSFLEREEKLLEKRAGCFSTGDMEYINNHLTLFKDIVWGLENDVLSNIEKIKSLSRTGGLVNLSREAFRKYRNINLILNSLDRLEVRGRDSAGIQINLELEKNDSLDRIISAIRNKGLYGEWLYRTKPGDLMDGCIQISRGAGGSGRVLISFTYKKASVTGRLGENGRYLRHRIESDELFHAVAGEAIESDIYLAHTRWASVGSITEKNCHPVNNYTLNTENENSKEYPFYGKGDWFINVALNGDIDNYRPLRDEMEPEGEELIDTGVTTDTKIIPLRIEKYLFEGHGLREAFRRALCDFEGSHAIAMESNLEPGAVFLALRGSGQSLYVGLFDSQYMFASELYGLVELTTRFIKMDGETERIAGNPGTRGQIFVLRNDRNGVSGIDALYYDGHPLELSNDIIQNAEITTRDIDRRDYPHFLLKEIMEAPLSVKKTLRGKYSITGRKGSRDVTFNLGEDIISPRLRDALGKGLIKNIFVVGQGTAAVAGAAVSEALAAYLGGANINIKAKASSELSGFLMRDNLADTLVIAVTQSGTTTDTNRAVAMAKERNAHLISIVNRRQSDITHVTDGVFYTSDGRDIEMSVASTKAFYAQIVAGFILALDFAGILGTMSGDRIAEELLSIESAPKKMERVIETRNAIQESARDMAKKKRYWAIVGSGPNKVAADEIRIKLSELCYKTISSDIVEDKKHIDLSSEPLIIACAAGNPEPVIQDIVKDISIFKAHQASVVVIADEKERRFNGIADYVISVPSSSFPSSVILNTMAGHLWGYYAACSINEEGEFFRRFRNDLSERTMELDRDSKSLFEKIADLDIHRIVENFYTEFHKLRNKGFFSSMSVEVVSDIILLIKYVVGKLPIEDFWQEYEEKRPSSSPFDMLDISLGRAVDELLRPVDAIRHQAKTVTVGTSRKSEIQMGILFEFMREIGFSIENLTSRDGFTVKRLQKALSLIRGYTLYDIANLDYDGRPSEFTTICISKRGGVSRRMKSRVNKPGPLKGTKKNIVDTGEVYAGLGKTDKAPVVIVPLLGKDHGIRHILLIHVIFKNDLTASEKKEVLGDKFSKINNLVNEYNIAWDDKFLDAIPVESLLGEGVDVIAGKIMKSPGENGR